jgi:protein-L-isoaspartate O-methyltransferase
VTDVEEQLRARFQQILVESREVRDSGWLIAFSEVARDIFVPEFFEQVPGGDSWALRRRPDEEWFAGVFSNRPLITQLDGDDNLTVRAREGELVTGIATSSSSMPTLMALMLDALAVQPGDRVLEIGTGTGYNTALLCHQFGAAAVTSVDVDEQLVATARRRLAGLGHHPRLVCQDGTETLPLSVTEGRKYDRILVTVATKDVPISWLEQLRPGGVLLFPLDRHNQGGLLARLVLGQDGTAAGHFLPDYGGFMPVRVRPRVTSASRAFRDVHDLGPARSTALPASVVIDETDPFEFFAALTVPGGGCDHLIFTPSNGGPVETWLAQDDGSWACHVTNPEDGRHRVHQGGPAQLWDNVELAHSHWRELGGPGRRRCGLTVTGDDTSLHAWLDEPNNIIARVTR